jgi:IPT/TIG domain
MPILYDVPAGSTATIDGPAEVRVKASSSESSYVLYDTGAPPGPPAPVISTLTPSDAVLPSAAVIVDGSNFSAAAVVVFGGVEVATVVISEMQLSADLTAAEAGDYEVLVRDGVDSNIVMFTFTAAGR